MENFDDAFKAQAVQAIDLILVKACRVKIANPEALGEPILQLAKFYAANKGDQKPVTDAIII